MIEDLKNFATTFKVGTRVPPDILGLLANNLDKQKKIQEKALAEAAELELKSASARSARVDREDKIKAKDGASVVNAE